MKISKEDGEKLYKLFDEALDLVFAISSSIEAGLTTYKESLKSDTRVKDVDKRFRWDIYYAVTKTKHGNEIRKIFREDNECKDSHIDTFLKSYVKSRNY